MRVLLIATNQADRYMDRMAVRPLPVGLAYVAAYIDEARYHLEILDLMFAEDGVTATRYRWIGPRRCAGHSCTLGFMLGGTATSGRERAMLSSSS